MQVIRQNPYYDPNALSRAVMMGFNMAKQQQEQERREQAQLQSVLTRIMLEDSARREREKEAGERQFRGQALLKGFNYLGDEPQEGAMQGPYGSYYMPPDRTSTEWKPQSMEEAIALKEAGRAPQGWKPQSKEEALELKRAGRPEQGWKPKTKEEAFAYKQAGQAPKDGEEKVPPKVKQAQSLVLKLAGQIDPQAAMILALKPEMAADDKILDSLRTKCPPKLQPAFDAAIEILNEYYGPAPKIIPYDSQGRRK